MESPWTSREAVTWLVKEWSEKLSAILESMADQRPSLGPPEVRETQPSTDGLIWCQRFETGDDPAIWIVTPGDTCIHLGRRTLEAAGVENSEIADCQNTYLEILNQSMSALGQSLSARLDTKASATDGEYLTALPDGLQWTEVSIEFGGVQLEPISIAASGSLVEQLTADPAPVEIPEPQKAIAPERPAVAAKMEAEQLDASGSRTFEVLLDVSLPVSISFGRTFLPIKDVLKLNSGQLWSSTARLPNRWRSSSTIA